MSDGIEPLGASTRLSSRKESLRSLYAIAVMWLAVAAVYVPRPSAPGDNTLLAIDYLQLHARRIKFAQQALFGPQAMLPAWYPRELFGTPFWSNIQNFPFIPTRLILLGFDPLNSMAVGVLLASCLAALFTFLYCRRLGLGRIAAATAGWTVAAAGYFAARVMAGHLPLLEAYPALPLLLWLVEVERQSSTRDLARPWKLGAIGLAAAAVALAGHPQLPAYALTTAAVYALFRNARTLKRGIRVLTSMALGFGCAAFALWPMINLIRRSSRLLPLDPPANDVVFPYRRLAAFFFPWSDGWPATVARPFPRPFTRFPNEAYFWDTVCYVGWLPWVAVAALVIGTVYRRKKWTTPWKLLALMGAIGFLFSLPLFQGMMAGVPGTILRSPARLMYLPTFTLALATGALVDAVLRSRALQSTRSWLGTAVVAIALTFHAIDLGSHSKSFVSMIHIEPFAEPELMGQLRNVVGDGRIAVDYALASPFNRDFDDVGFFDSIMLAKPYRALMDLAQKPPRYNVQAFNASELSVEALRFAGVNLVVTPTRRTDLKPLSDGSGIQFYGVPNASPRCSFIPYEAAEFLNPERIHDQLRAHLVKPLSIMVAPGDYGITKNASQAASPRDGELPTVRYERPSSDRITLNVSTTRPGFLKILESWDPGWRATVDGVEARIVAADDAFIAIPMAEGRHEVHLTYATPHAGEGLVISGASLVLLSLLIACERRKVTSDRRTATARLQ